MYFDTTQSISVVEQFIEITFPSIRERRKNLELRLDTDDFTRLLNRRAFDKAQTSATLDAQTAFIFFDANNFGRINKDCGHQEGDRVLKFYSSVIGEVARRFKSSAFRYGSGDEFIIICRKRFAGKIRDSVEKRCTPISYDDFTVSISGEIGATLAEADALLQSRKRARKSLDSAA